jgi:hypothetical protein
MSKLILTADQLQKLSDDPRTLFADENGKIVGMFTPLDLSKIELEISEEELLRREKSDKWYSTAEVLAYLEKL